MKTKRLVLLLFFAAVVMIGSAFPALAGEEGLQILIPSIEVEAPIVPVYIRQFENGDVTWDVRELQMTVGHFEGMPAVGQGGNTVLAGHSERARGEADIFYNLHRVAVGDHIIITSEDATYRYEVQRIFSVDPRDLSVLYPSGAEQLTLITCDLTSFEEDGSYSRRTVVVAERTR